jgi:type II secretion system protein C
MAADLAHIVAGVRWPSVAPAPAPARTRPPHNVAAQAWRISHAHLFGTDKAPSKAADAAETQLALALTGTIATRDPTEGYAILGEKGKAAHLYRTGVALGDGLSGRLYRTFTDHVVLELNGHLETLKLPRQPAAAGLTDAAAQTETIASSGAQSIPAADPAASNAAESWFELLHPQHRIVSNQTVGIKLRPDMRIQRQYDLRYNDVLTAVNGVDIAGPSSFQDLKETLKGAGKSVQLTVIRNGVSQVLTVPVADGL